MYDFSKAAVANGMSREVCNIANQALMADTIGCSHSLDPLAGPMGPKGHSQGGQSQAFHRQNLGFFSLL